MSAVEAGDAGDGGEPVGDTRDWRADALELARGVLRLADDAGMPDVYWHADSSVTLARDVLGVPEFGRYSHEHMWAKAGE